MVYPATSFINDNSDCIKAYAEQHLVTFRIAADRVWEALAEDLRHGYTEIDRERNSMILSFERSVHTTSRARTSAISPQASCTSATGTIVNQHPRPIENSCHENYSSSSYFSTDSSIDDNDDDEKKTTKKVPMSKSRVKVALPKNNKQATAKTKPIAHKKKPTKKKLNATKPKTPRGLVNSWNIFLKESKLETSHGSVVWKKLTKDEKYAFYEKKIAAAETLNHPNTTPKTAIDTKISSAPSKMEDNPMATGAELVTIKTAVEPPEPDNDDEKSAKRVVTPALAIESEVNKKLRPSIWSEL